MDISVIIPTLNAADKLRRVLESLKGQTSRPGEIIIIDSSSTDNTVEIAEQFGCITSIIPPEDFNHGRTRNIAARTAQGEILVFMTQDAIPCDDRMLELLTHPLRDGRAAAAYARQIANRDAYPHEMLARQVNYPDQSHIKTMTDLGEMGIKTFFFSNAASAVLKREFELAGEFPEDVIVNEDMLLCSRLLAGGLAVAYQADALVFHSHNYSLAQQFKRYFDIGVFMAQAGGALFGAKTTGQGRRFVCRQLRVLLSDKKYLWFLRTCADNCFRYLGFILGRNHGLLPRRLKKRLSAQRGFWDGK
jgi:rhamnosyltransferase